MLKNTDQDLSEFCLAPIINWEGKQLKAVQYIPFLGPAFYSQLGGGRGWGHLRASQGVKRHVGSIGCCWGQNVSQLLELLLIFLPLLFQGHCKEFLSSLNKCGNVTENCMLTRLPQKLKINEYTNRFVTKSLTTFYMSTFFYSFSKKTIATWTMCKKYLEKCKWVW